MDQVLLISTYELGRQPFGLASPAAWLENAGARVVQQDLAVTEFDPDAVRTALMIGVYVPMHTATRMAEPVLARIREINPDVHLCVYGLYAPMNAEHLRALGADSIIGGEFEQPLVDLYQQLAAARTSGLRRGLGRRVVSLDRQQFRTPSRAGLPALSRYAALRLGDGRTRTVGYTEASRGCKHLCRHCPIVPVYGGRFRIVQAETVLADVRQQVAAGAQHITFGDPDFFNAPGHAMRIVDRLHDEFPDLTYDVTIKVEHLRRHAHLIPTLKGTGCVLVTSAVEAVDAEILKRLDKNHTVDDLQQVLRLLHDAGLALNPTFVAFTPWTTVPGYAQFLQAILRLRLVDLITPVQYGIRLLIPAGSRILELDDVRPLLSDFDPTALAYPWSNPDPQVDQLHRQVLDLVQADQRAGLDRRQIFTHVWQATAAQLGAPSTPDLRDLPDVAASPQLTEPWYCCAEPTEEQLARL
jgi:radical SAM superfamily enzyme YgiQ (UPF0313 family)